MANELPAFLTESTVAFVQEKTVYCAKPPYDPSENYPEWPGQLASAHDNPAYRGVRMLFRSLGFDQQNFGTVQWNPLGGLIRPGDHVVLKPNFVSHFNLGEKAGITDTDSLITHGSIIRVVLDYVGKALNHSGCITLFDCPIQGADWNAIIELAGLDSISATFRSRFPGITLEIKDLRIAVAEVKMVGRTRVITARKQRDVDSNAYQEIDLKEASYLIPLIIPGARFGVSEYPESRMRAAHSRSTNKYIFPRELLDADVVINLPKLKTHCKGGITCALKNFVGINGHKDYLPHFRFGPPSAGGDEFPNGNGWWRFYWFLKHRAWNREGGTLKFLLNYLAFMARKAFPLFCGVPASARSLGGGSWQGNDTLWRMVLDINRAYFYLSDLAPQPQNRPARRQKYFAVVDGIVGGEGEGPLSPRPKPAGFLLAGHNPVAIDVLAAQLIGFDYRRIPQLAQAFRTQDQPLPLVRFAAEGLRIATMNGDSPMTLPFGSFNAKATFRPAVGFQDLVAKAESSWNPLGRAHVQDFYGASPDRASSADDEQVALSE